MQNVEQDSIRSDRPRLPREDGHCVTRRANLYAGRRYRDIEQQRVTTDHRPAARSCQPFHIGDGGGSDTANNNPVDRAVSI